MKMEIKPLNCDADVHITSGINGQMTNSGAQHFHEGEKRIFDKKYLQLIQTTTESKIDFVVNAVHRYMIDGKEVETEPRMAIDRRKVFIQVSFHVKRGRRSRLKSSPTCTQAATKRTTMTHTALM